jgi:hypothetical protein
MLRDLSYSFQVYFLVLLYLTLYTREYYLSSNYNELTTLNPLSFLGPNTRHSQPIYRARPSIVEFNSTIKLFTSIRHRRLSRAQAHRENIFSERAKHLERKPIAAHNC